ncbi:multidrug effflux MFS transporter [Pseudohongiella nitratireducens]|uniref:multidrug effflux MFS transporter n=1 Tax=Pseudohongiella nitratireducens TaxID=1768907 RepID=UPI0024092AC8|nr:multidrug effflux MFS transporter [Pseudohongiella nitratireducens]MDF1623470.1 multidrug effflux MFS transporter [Pseudohongiella nitratireducens]
MTSEVKGFSRRMIILLASVSALGPVGMQIMLPAIPTIRDAFEISNGTAQLTLSLSMFSIAVATLIYGPLSDRFGRRPVMLVGIFITFLGSLLCVMADSIGMLIFGRIVQAAGGAVGLVLARAIVRDVYPANQAAGIIATLVMVMVVMPMISPLVGGELLVRYDWHSIFYVMAGISLLLMLALLISLPETASQASRDAGSAGMLHSFVTLLKSRGFCAYALNVAFVSVVFFSFISAAPEIMVSVFERPPNEYGYYYIVIPAAFMGGNYLTRWLTKRVDGRRMIAVGSQISIVGISAALALHLIGVVHPLALFLPISICTFGNGISLPNAQAAAINEFPDMAGAASGLSGFMQMGLSALAAQLVALIYNGTIYPMLSLMLTASVISLLSFYLAGRVSTSTAKQ